MAIQQLGYLVFSSADIGAWRTLAEDVLGLAIGYSDEHVLHLKMDDRDFRIAIVPGATEHLFASGWECASKADFEHVRQALSGNQVRWEQGSAELCSSRKVKEIISFQDPAGNRLEVYWGFISDFRPFSPPGNIDCRFVTDQIGMGHVVLPASDLAATQSFYESALGFALSDMITMQFGPGLVEVMFNHCSNVRQHSLALAGMASQNGCVHFCLEVENLKQVGMALDRVENSGHPLVLTLGQHVNDDCVSFYFLSPHGFMIEIGCGSVLKDWDQHTVFETTRPSHWGHRFVLNS